MATELDHGRHAFGTPYYNEWQTHQSNAPGRDGAHGAHPTCITAWTLSLYV